MLSRYLVLVALVAATALSLMAQPASAQRGGGDVFDRLDDSIAANVPQAHRTSYLRQAQHAREAFLPPNPCKKPNFGPLNALEHHVTAQTGKQISDSGASEIRAVIADIRLLPPNPCTGG